MLEEPLPWISSYEVAASRSPKMRIIAALPAEDSMSASRHLDDTAILARARNGDVDAFNRLVLENERPVYSLAYRLMGNPDDAADATQDAFLNAFRAIHGFRGEAIRPWLFRIAVRCCYDQLRRRKRRREDSLEGDTDDEGIDLPDDPELVRSKGPYALRQPKSSSRRSTHSHSINAPW